MDSHERNEMFMLKNHRYRLLRAAVSSLIGDEKVDQWFRTKNPMLGDVHPDELLWTNPDSLVRFVTRALENGSISNSEATPK